MPMMDFTKQLSHHYMAISRQENGCDVSFFARNCLFDLIDSNGKDWRADYHAIKAQKESEMEYRFARQRMGIKEEDYDCA